MVRPKWNKALRRTFLYAFVVFFSAPFIFVFVWMVMASLKTQLQNTAIPPLLFFEPTLANYDKVFNRTPVVQYFLNSVIIALGSTGLGLLLGLPAAFSIAVWRQHFLALTVLSSRILPGMSYLLPWFILFSTIRQIGTHQAVILSHLTVTMPLVIWILIGFFEDLPGELFDAARIDGCSIYGTFMRVALPLSMPGVVVSGILAFIFSWNNFMLSLILGGSAVRTLPVAVYSFMGETMIDWGGLNATATTVTLPVVLFVLIVQKHVVRGLTLGAVKG
ncbi:MAG: carbohydrate ABC transporter permease [Chloroflexi bacterium]|nr:carbohydrate ABC transporter permease [Chloroflexota bacterium]MCL5109163.1 carbohydrate ABC transporter permease [Chloroflexota bacterium]